ncbi:methyltransferase [Microlunatus ginsengisoli]|uniref:Class I SAM-dependent methyltransferase n=1 Tax=Microlunatus ginsengisoli TaxID=363863 RepID=A0ABP6ZII4_9ACTN
MTDTEIATERELGPTAGAASDRPRLLADFDRAAARYDLMVALNPGYHRHLRSAATALMDRLPSPDRGSPDRGSPDRGVSDRGAPSLLDLGCGSGASTRALLAAEGRVLAPSIVAVDASAGMLARARDKDWPGDVRFRQGLAQDLPSRHGDWGIRAPLDGAFAAYLFRNLPGAGAAGHSVRDDVLQAVRDLLRPGGVFVTQEYSLDGSRSARVRWTAVCRAVVMPLSRLTRTDVALYDYLWHSVLSFDSVERFADRLWRAGFVDVEVRTVRGWQHGILHTFRARVPC